MPESPHEGDQQAGTDEERKGSDEESEREREAEEAAISRAKKTEAAPSAKEVVQRNLDQAALRSWCLHGAKGRAEEYGRLKKAQGERDAPGIGVDYAYLRAQQEKEEEKGRPMVAMKGSRARSTTRLRW